MIRRTSQTRRGFTLLEVMLASAIGLVILYGLYSAIDVQLKFTESGRRVVEQATVARSIAARLTADLTPYVGLNDPTQFTSSSSSTSPTSSSPTSSSPTSSTPSSSTPSSSSPSSSTPGSSSQNGTSTPVNPIENDLVRVFYGDSTSLRMWVSRVPRYQQVIPGTGGLMDADSINSDQRHIIYWLAGAGSNPPLGLARYETSRTLAASQDLPVVIGAGDEKDHVIAPEVLSLQFSYFNGSSGSWEDSWDSRTLDQDGMTPIGPPWAVAIQMDLDVGTDKPRKFRHVIAIPTASGIPQAVTPSSASGSGQ